MKTVSTAALAAALMTCAGAATAQTTETDAQWGLRMIGAQAAYDRGYTGSGIVVGILDGGLDMTHPEFRGRLHPFSFDVTTNGPVVGDLPNGHGTHVAGIIGAARDGRGMHGVAYNSRLMILGLAGETPEDQDMIAAGLTQLGLANGARIFNNSWGFNHYAGTPGGLQSFRTEMTLQTAQFRAGVAQDAIFVFATGNEGQLTANVQAGLPFYVPELQPNWLAVTAVGPNGAVQGYANNCGVAANWCLAAPGGSIELQINSTLPGGGYGPSAGTSMAAPHVTGAVAIAREMFPNSRGSQLTRLVLATATDMGARGIDAESGWGLLNIGNMAQTRDAVAASPFANGSWAATRGQSALIEVLGQRLNSPAERGLWGQVLGARAEHDPTSQSNGAEAETVGVVAGGDLLSGAATLGFALSYLRTEMTETGAANEAIVEAWGLSAYGAARQGAWFVQGTAGLATRELEFTRATVVGAAGTVLEGQGLTGLAEADGLAVYADVRLGLAVQTGLGELRPFVHGRVQHWRMDAFAEQEADVFSLSVPELGRTGYEAGPGVELALAPFEAGPAAMSGELGVRHDFVGGDDDHAVPALMLGSPVPGAVGSLGDATTVSGALRARYGERVEAGVQGFWSVADRADQGGVSLGLRVSF